jgi:transposase
MKIIKNLTRLTLGLDMGDRKTNFAVLSFEGEVIEEGVIPTTPSDFERVFARFRASVAVLEVGSQSRWSSELLSNLGLKVYVANPRQIKLIDASTDKDDRLDAIRLARLARFDSTLLHQIFHRSSNLQTDLESLKARQVLVEIRTKLVNHMRGVLKSFGVKVKKPGSWRFFFTGC